ncbi:MAG: methyltransferase [Candidatus Nitrohelix vancouverensis]|uniref:Methyltransferase n=1 Tax=Candidatus Nitrohelix vancouverensis TaxID=2705534 RepID=A0A7T0C3T4_9BACT|nr:MAG: methyltransferase [Candidatus Nitrohelix vancouverensis]
MNSVYFDNIQRPGRWSEFSSALRFISDREIPLKLSGKADLLYKFHRISSRVDCPHTQSEMLSLLRSAFSASRNASGVFVEAGCYKGGSSAKFSLAAKLTGRKLFLFDSFRGIPQHEENHTTNIYGRPVTFSQGEYSGSLDEVTRNISHYGNLESCEFIPGWLESTLPHFKEEVALAYLDVDLASSTKTCIKHLYPLIQPGGILMSQDGHLPLVIDVFNDDRFWEEEVGVLKPLVEGLGKQKLIRIVKPLSELEQFQESGQ